MALGASKIEAILIFDLNHGGYPREGQMYVYCTSRHG